MARLWEVGERARAGVEEGELALLPKRGADCDVLLPRLPGGVGVGGPIPDARGQGGCRGGVHLGRGGPTRCGLNAAESWWNGFQSFESVYQLNRVPFEPSRRPKARDILSSRRCEG